MSAVRAEEHLGLAAWVVHDMTRTNQTMSAAAVEDLIGVATVALVEVAQRYDESVGAFATYAVKRIRGAVLDELRRLDWASRSVRDGRHRIARAHAALSVELGREPTTAELADRLGLTGVELDELRADVHRALVVDLDGLTHDGGQPFDAPIDTPNPEELILRREEHRHLRACVAVLPDQLREVVVRNFFHGDSLTAIAADLGLTVGRVSQARQRAVVLLRAAWGHVWDERVTEPSGGMRARREEREFVARAAVECRSVA